MSTWTWTLLAAAAPVVLAVTVLCLREPMRVGLPLFAAAVPFGKGLAISGSPFASASSLLGMVVAAGLVLGLVGGRRSAPVLAPSVGIWLLFLGFAALSSLWSIDRGASILGVLVLGSLVLLYVLAATAEVDATVLRRTENGVLVGGSASVLYGLYQLVVLGGFPGDRGGIAPEGRFGNDLLGPNIQAVTLLLPLAVALSRTVRARSVQSRALNAVLVALAVTGVLMTGSRTGSVAAVILGITLLLVGPRKVRRSLLLFVVVGVAAGVVVWTYHPAGIAERTFESAGSSSGRTDIWEVGLAACEEYCAVGSGWGTYPTVYAETQASVPGARVLVGEKGTYQPHNLWLLAAVELGVTGLALLCWGLASGLRECLRIPSRLRGVPLSLMTALLFAVFFLSSMEFKFFWLILVMIALYRNVTVAESGAPAVAVDEARRDAT